MSLAHTLAEPLADARADIARLEARAREQGLTLPAAPEPIDPRVCCGRGCSPCMYTYYFAAVDAWREKVTQQLDALVSTPP